VSIKLSIKRLLKRELNINFTSNPKLLGVEKFFFLKDFYGKKNKIEYVSHLYLIKLKKNEIKNIILDNDHLKFIFLNKNEINRNKNVIGQIKKFIKNNF
tara:strand:- start:426 stop:722 length:297 start_codon:yes stop_codon:yes gene_type:complete